MSEYYKLTKEERGIIINKGTEAPFTGEYDNFFIEGFYHCRQCDSVLYSSDNKFKSSCGWPSFDDELPGSIDQKLDSDGRRIEILCAKCGGHLGHLFKGENYTEKNQRYCVNSLSIRFKESATAYFAGGCFWGVEHLMQKKDGVYSVISGYMGGTINKPTYEEVCTGKSGHLEVVQVIYNPSVITYEELTKFFFEIHDPTQSNGQGPDIGEQYLSAIFYTTEIEKEIVKGIITLLTEKGFDVVTKVLEVSKFWSAEEYHQDYYIKHRKEPYCHMYKKIF